MEIPRNWRLKAQRYRLEGEICPSCGQLIFPPRPVCLQRHGKTTRRADFGLPIVLSSISKFKIEPRIRYQIMEKMMG